MIIAKRSGFSLMEIMVVVFIIGLLASLVGPRVMQLMFKGQASATKSTIASLKSALADFKMGFGRFPTQKEGLEILVANPGNLKGWDGPYLEGEEEVPQDGWNFQYIYNKPAQHFKQYKYYEIISYGSDDGDATPQDKWIHGGQ